MGGLSFYRLVVKSTSLYSFNITKETLFARKQQQQQQQQLGEQIYNVKRYY